MDYTFYLYKVIIILKWLMIIKLLICAEEYLNEILYLIYLCNNLVSPHFTKKEIEFRKPVQVHSAKIC